MSEQSYQSPTQSPRYLVVRNYDHNHYARGAGAAYLFFVQEPKWIGFRAPSAGNRFLQARRKGADRLRLYNETFGTYEQWEVRVVILCVFACTAVADAFIRALGLFAESLIIDCTYKVLTANACLC